MPLTPEQQAALPHCPFCGRAPRYLPKQEGFYVESVICDTCHVSLPRAVWSRRAVTQPVQPDTDRLLAIIASAYQIAGAHDAPAHILDVLADPEAATVEQVEAMLPYQAGRVVADWQLQKVREALETYYRALTIKQPSAAQPAAIYAIEQAMGMSWMGWLASLPVGAAPAGLDERKE